MRRPLDTTGRSQLRPAGCSEQFGLGIGMSDSSFARTWVGRSSFKFSSICYAKVSSSLFVMRVKSDGVVRFRTENGAFRDEKQFILNQNWVTIKLDHFGDEEAQKVVPEAFSLCRKYRAFMFQIIRRRYPALNPIVARLLEAFRAVMSSASDRRCRDVTFR